MPMYRYKAMSAQGIIKEENETAGSYEEMLSRLRERNFYPIGIKEVNTGKEIKALPILGKVGSKQIALFTRQFATKLNAGVTIVNCLDILRQQTQNKRLRECTNGLYEDVQKGIVFSEALSKYKDVFPDLMVQMVAAGEMSGRLDIVMQRVAVHYEKETRINSRVKSAMVYPIVLAIVCVAGVIFLLTNVMPTFIGMFKGSDVPIPGPTLALLAISDALRYYWYIFVAAVAVIVIMFRRYAATKEGKLVIDRWKLRIPVVKTLSQKVASARFTRTLSTLLASGIPLLQSLGNVAGAVGNAVISESILAAREDVRKGVALSTPIRNSGYFPPMVHSMIEIGEESGSLDEMLDKTANIYDEEVEIEVQRMLSLLEPIMILFMAGIVGFIVIAMMLPMFGMLKTI